jgi:hypothetical protein
MSPLLLALILFPNRKQEISQAQLAYRTLGTCDSQPYSPLLTIRAINQVVSLGPTQAKNVLEGYFKVHPAAYSVGLYPLVCCIFDVPRFRGFLPPPAIKGFDPMPPFDLRKSPRYPFALSGDIPQWVAFGSSSGFSQSEGDHFMQLEQVAILRTKPLVPVNRPWLAVGGTALPDNVPFGAVRSGMNNDILRLVSTAFRARGYVPGKPFHIIDTPAGWRSIVVQMQRVGMYWDPDRQEYVRADGSVLTGK